MTLRAVVDDRDAWMRRALAAEADVRMLSAALERALAADPEGAWLEP